MNRPLVVSAFGGLVLLMWLAAWSVVGSAERAPELLTGQREVVHPDQLGRPAVDAIFPSKGSLP